MEKEISYNEAYELLEKLVEEIEDDKIQLDTLADKVKEANGLIKLCETKLRKIDGDVKSAAGDDNV